MYKKLLSLQSISVKYGSTFLMQGDWSLTFHSRQSNGWLLYSVLPIRYGVGSSLWKSTLNTDYNLICTMEQEKSNYIWQRLNLRYKAHPWHGISAGDKAPEIVRCYVEVVPGDEMKYEVDKETGYLMVDRPNKFSNTMPCMYGFIPRTYSAQITAAYCMKKTGMTNLEGDGDPLDVCILCDRKIPRGDLLVDVKIVGGFRMIDSGEVDDKLVGVLNSDHTYGRMNDIADCPQDLIKRIKHYFLTYKEDPDQGFGKSKVIIKDTYGREEALEVIKYGFQDYEAQYGKLETELASTLIEIAKKIST